MNFVNKPKSTEFMKFNITQHEVGRVLHTKYDVHADIESKDTWDSARSYESRLLQMMQMNENIKDRNLHLESGELPYFFLIFNLPENLCRYGEPLACQFLDEDIEEKESFVVEVEESQPNKRKRRNKRLLKDKKITESSKRATIASGFDNSPNHLHGNLYRPSLQATIRLSFMRRSVLPGIVLQNFSLVDRVMTSREKDVMHQNCMPRLLSSFKFPVEFKFEKEEEAKSKRCNLYLRRQFKDDDPKLIEKAEYFDYEKQEGPERLYPKFNKRLKVLYDQDLELESDVKGSGQGKSLYSVLYTIQDIQEKYMDRSLVLLNQTNYKPKFESFVVDISETNLEKSSHELPRSKNSKHNKHHSSIKHSIENSFMSNFSSQNLTIDPDMSHRSSRKSTTIEDTDMDDDPKKPKLVNVKHWTTKHIKQTIFDRKKLTITVKTDRLGLFGFAYKRYEHFPFRDWHLQLNEEK